MGDDIIHGCLIAVQVANRSPNLVMGRLFLPPPIACIPAVFIVLTMTAAKGKIFLVFDGVNFPTLQVKNIRGNQSCDTAPPANQPILLQQIKVFVTAIHKSNGIFLFAELFQHSPLLFGVVPDKPKIAADQQDISGTQFFHFRPFESAVIPVQISCYINHVAASLLFREHRTPLFLIRLLSVYSIIFLQKGKYLSRKFPKKLRKNTDVWQCNFRNECSLL